ncbi:hypothetical protein ATY30_06905 [Sinorhizobium americanum]|nr:hypothetical protein CO664_03155 [Sinorhizobium sp. NG07B]POH31223.1 hypothetical protein ATY30_06905 [Sinorhizobium americanum]
MAVVTSRAPLILSGRTRTLCRGPARFVAFGDCILIGAADAEVLAHIVGRLRQGINTEGRPELRAREASAGAGVHKGRRLKASGM